MVIILCLHLLANLQKIVDVLDVRRGDFRNMHKSGAALKRKERAEIVIVETLPFTTSPISKCINGFILLILS